MFRHVFRLWLSVLLLSCVGSAQQTNTQTPQGPGLQTAAPERRYEPPSPTATPAELEKRGDDFREVRAYADAIDYYRAALSNQHDKTTQAVLYNKIGIAELQQFRPKDAQKDFERALKRNHKYSEALNNLGAAFYMQKKYGKAEKYYKRALELNENNASFHNNLATAYFMEKRYPEAATEYRRALELDPMVFERSSRVGIEAKLSNSENRATYDYMVAKLYASLGDLDHCIQYLKKAMEDGYKEINNVYKDQEFTALRKDPRFAELMASKPTPIPE